MSLSPPPHGPGGTQQPSGRRGADSQDGDRGPAAESLVPGIPDEPGGEPGQDRSYDQPSGQWPQYDQAGYDQAGYDQAGYDQAGYDQAGYDQAGYDQAGYDQASGQWPQYDQHGYDQPSGQWPQYDQHGYDQPSGQWPQYDQDGYDQASGEPRRRGRRRWPWRRMLLPAAVALLLIIGIAVAGTGMIRGNPAAQGREASPAPHPSHSTTPASQAPAPHTVTLAGARQILSSYLAANNTANKLRSSSALAAIEGGSSYAIDAGNYRWTRVTDPENLNYRPVTLADPDYYLPQQSGYPLWFAVRGTWVAGGSSTQVWSAAYLVFARATPGARWLEIFEPNIIPSGPSIHIATDQSGNAEQASTAGLPVPPAGIPDLTARFLDGASAGLAWPGGPGNLADLAAQAFWHVRLPAGSTDSDSHSPAGNQVLGLRTANGGALLFFGLAATVTVAHGTVAVADTDYADQVAVYVPPGAGSGWPQVVADASGVTSHG